MQKRKSEYSSFSWVSPRPDKAEATGKLEGREGGNREGKGSGPTKKVSEET